ncbi:MAG: ABC transporter substrate-binding protein [Thermoleophilia bacterium]
MHRLRVLLAALLVAALALGLAACGDDDDSASSTPDTTATSAAIPAVADLDLVSAGTLTIGTDKPAYPPYFEDDDPSNGRGFESAVGYAIAERLGFARDQVKWVTVPFNSSYAPGKKNFDFDINQISITPKRAEQVDFSAPYYTSPQAVIIAAGSDLDGVTDLAGLKDATFGVQVGTTSLDAVNDIVQPSTQPRVYDNSNDVVSALKNDQVDAVVVDLPTAYYLTAAEIEGGKILGQFAAPGGDDWGVVLARGSGLTPAVDAAIAELRASGELDRLTERWMGGNGAVPELS